MKTVWLLDVDGVINATRPGWSEAPHNATVSVFKIRWAPSLLRHIRALQRSGLVDIMWSSTWCSYPLELQDLQRALRLELPRAFGDRPPSKTWGELKAHAVVDALGAGHRVIWTDDSEVRAGRQLYPAIAEAEEQGRALLIDPRDRHGLQPEHMAAIEAFVLNTDEESTPAATAASLETT